MNIMLRGWYSDGRSPRKELPEHQQGLRELGVARERVSEKEARKRSSSFDPRPPELPFILSCARLSCIPAIALECRD